MWVMVSNRSNRRQHPVVENDAGATYGLLRADASGILGGRHLLSLGLGGLWSRHFDQGCLVMKDNEGIDVMEWMWVMELRRWIRGEIERGKTKETASTFIYSYAPTLLRREHPSR